MFEIRIHGRAGQGAKLAAQLLADAGLLEGKFIQAFPEYGPERTGAPVVSYCRLDDQEIRAHYPILHPDAVLVLDTSLLEVVDFVSGATSETILLVNSNFSAEVLRKKYTWPGKIYTLPASEIALKILGANRPNTVLLGLLLKVSQPVKYESLQAVLRAVFADKKPELIEKNLAAMEAGYRFK